MRNHTAVFLLLLVTALTVPLSAQDCPAIAGIPGYHLQPNTSVTVYLDPAFTEAQRTTLTYTIQAWQLAAANQTGVTFNFTTGAPPSPDSPGAVTVSRSTPTTPGYIASTVIDPEINSGLVRIDPTVTSNGAIANLMAHELGHLLGLADCVGCAPGTSVMNLPTSANDETSGRSEPTPCDLATSNQRFADDTEEEMVAEPTSGGDHQPMEDASPEQCYLVVWYTYMRMPNGRIVILDAVPLYSYCM